MNKNLKSTFVALSLVVALSHTLSPVQAHATASVMLSKPPVVMQSRHFVYVIRPISLWGRPVLMQQGRFVYLSNRQYVQVVKRFVVY